MDQQAIKKKQAKYCAGICGHFGGTGTYLDGQTVKTKNVTAALRKALGNAQITTLDTYGGAKALLRCLNGLWYMLRYCRNIIILPAQNSVKIFPPFLILLNRFYHRGLHYIVIGGWLPELVKRKRVLSKTLQKLDGIYVETSSMKQALEAEGFKNIWVMPNFKELKILKPEQFVCQTEPPYRVCTFSRVMKEKGIEDAVTAVKAVNEEAGRVLYTLDIYGQIDKSYAKAFASLQTEFPPYVRYGGMIPFEKSVEVLKDYFALLFPTHFYTEGIPGSIIDAFAAGIPVISAKWGSFSDVVEDGKTGVGFSSCTIDELEGILRKSVRHPSFLMNMKLNCLRKAQKFTPEAAVKILLERLT